jgi:hypothetical protein
MSDPVDLREWLASWPYDPEHDVRTVRGRDGRAVLQVRLPLGIEQYELDGRPDGQRPHGRESALEYQRGRLSQARAAGADAAFSLSAEDCAELFHEGTLYYYRYLHLFQARDWQRTVRDTARNLKLFDFVRRYAARPEDQVHLEKWRPYLVRVNASAAAMGALEAGAYDRALATVQTAVDQIEGLEEMEEATFKFERDRSLLALRELASQIRQSQPLSERQRLERALRQAIEAQEFERAAQLRDRLRALRAKEAPT